MDLIDRWYRDAAVIRGFRVHSRWSVFAGDGWFVVQMFCEELFPALQLLAKGGVFKGMESCESLIMEINLLLSCV